MLAIDRIEECSRVNSRRGAAHLLADMADQAGFELASLTHDLSDLSPLVDPNGERIYVAMGWPDWFIEQWEQQQFRLDNPCNVAVRLNASAFWWTLDDLSKRFQTPKQRKIIELWHSIGVTAGITAPIHMQHGRVGQISMVSKRHSDLSRSFETHGLNIKIAGLALLDALDRAEAKPQSTGFRNGIVLTGREVECINGVASGLSDDEIAVRINISYATVRFHVSNASRKLGARTRGHMIALASQSGWISPLH